MDIEKKVEELEKRVIRLEVQDENQRKSRKRRFWITLIIGLLLVGAVITLLYSYAHIFIEILG